MIQKLSGTVAALSEVPSLMADLAVDDDVHSSTDSVTEAHDAAGKCYYCRSCNYTPPPPPHF